jgi:hypothetical protein
VIVGCGLMVHISMAMFRMTRQEQMIVAFLVGAMVLGIAVREWRARRPQAKAVAETQRR